MVRKNPKLSCAGKSEFYQMFSENILGPTLEGTDQENAKFGSNRKYFDIKDQQIGGIMYVNKFTSYVVTINNLIIWLISCPITAKRVIM